jgi:hypothetical protein
LVEFVLASFTALFVTVSPIKVAAIYPVLTEGVAREDQRRMAVRAVVVAFGLLLLFALFGDDLLRTSKTAWMPSLPSPATLHPPDARHAPGGPAPARRPALQRRAQA